MLEAAIAVVLSHALSANPAAMDSDSVYACKRISVSEDQECIDCMSAACGIYEIALAACGGSESCRQIAKAEYELDLLLCATCDPQAQGILMLTSVLPLVQQEWIVYAYLANW